jgi:signal transduction histidine kinase
LLQRNPPPEDWRDDMTRGLQVIASRTESLSRFTAAYSRLARLPAPTLAPVVLKPLLVRIAGLETRVPVHVKPGPDITVNVDTDQIEQLFINLIRNAADACLEIGDGAVGIDWRRTRHGLEIWVDDEGPGLSNTTNLFVPFFTTKPGGSGIGLVLCRQIAEAHEGSLKLENKPGGRGARATLTLPL